MVDPSDQQGKLSDSNQDPLEPTREDIYSKADANEFKMATDSKSGDSADDSDAYSDDFEGDTSVRIKVK